MKAQMCRFKRYKDGKWETGVMIGTEDDETHLIVDEGGFPVTAREPLYDFNLTPENGCFETPAEGPPEIKAKIHQPDITAMQQSMLKQNLIHLLVAHVSIPYHEYFDIDGLDIDTDRQAITAHYVFRERPADEEPE